MSYYSTKQYAQDLTLSAKKDLNILFFKSALKSARKILDIGCSVGRIISLDPERIQGVDIDKSALKIARTKGFNVKDGDIAKGLHYQDNEFDGIYCSQVLEHLKEPLLAMKEIKRVLKKQGKLVLITPDYIMSSRKYSNGFWCDYTHQRPFVPETLKRIAHDAGFKKFRVYHFPGKGFRNLIRWGLLDKESWIRLEKLPFIWTGQDLILEATK